MFTDLTLRDKRKRRDLGKKNKTKAAKQLKKKKMTDNQEIVIEFNDPTPENECVSFSDNTASSIEFVDIERENQRKRLALACGIAIMLILLYAVFFF